MRYLKNFARDKDRTTLAGIPDDMPFPSDDLDAAWHLLQRCPIAAETPLRQSEALANLTGVSRVWVKDERQRMDLGSFKALGAAYVIASDAAEKSGSAFSERTYVTASAGNHGLSVAAGARAFGAKAVIYIAQTVPESFAERLRNQDAKVIREGVDYEASMRAALDAANQNRWHLLSDSSWEGYSETPYKLMEGYLALLRETVIQIDAPPSHIFLQAGVGGMAAAIAAGARHVWGQDPIIVVVEPDAAPALQASIKAKKFVVAAGPVSTMGRLDCKEASLIALKGLHRDADFFVTLSENEVLDQMNIFEGLDLATSPSGGAGLAALLCDVSSENLLGLNAGSSVLAILSEGHDT